MPSALTAHLPEGLPEGGARSSMFCTRSSPPRIRRPSWPAASQVPSSSVSPSNRPFSRPSIALPAMAFARGARSRSSISTAALPFCRAEPRPCSTNSGMFNDPPASSIRIGSCSVKAVAGQEHSGVDLRDFEALQVDSLDGEGPGRRGVLFRGSGGHRVRCGRERERQVQVDLPRGEAFRRIVEQGVFQVEPSAGTVRAVLRVQIRGDRECSGRGHLLDPGIEPAHTVSYDPIQQRVQSDGADLDPGLCPNPARSLGEASFDPDRPHTVERQPGRSELKGAAFAIEPDLCSKARAGFRQVAVVLADHDLPLGQGCVQDQVHRGAGRRNAKGAVQVEIDPFAHALVILGSELTVSEPGGEAPPDGRSLLVAHARIS